MQKTDISIVTNLRSAYWRFTAADTIKKLIYENMAYFQFMTSKIYCWYVMSAVSVKGILFYTMPW